eukprot:TRINITY_DN7473_c0_g1_i1.p1 TRINITY_DN7473_c0_g1~~TRINITY_DN7473_c0_g1_i1.p1  ORF type:complete len:1084 (+),score=166.81 TRINITY_DN7473_c0_g1_i1:62-3313(+)
MDAPSLLPPSLLPPSLWSATLPPILSSDHAHIATHDATDTATPLHVLSHASGEWHRTKIADLPSAPVCAWRFITSLTPSPLARFQSFLVLGDRDGALSFYLTAGTLLLRHTFIPVPVKKLFLQYSNIQEYGYQALLVCLHENQRLVLIDFEALGSHLQSYRTAGQAQKPAFSFKVYTLEDQMVINDLACIGSGDVRPLDEPIFLNAPLRSPFRFVTVGSNPMISLYAVREEPKSWFGGVPSVTAVASKLTSVVFSAAKSLWARPKAETYDPNVALSSSKGIPPSAGMNDKARTITSVVTSACGKYLATVDNFGRVLLVESDTFLALKMWKGYRFAQCQFMTKTVSNHSYTKKEIYLVILAPKLDVLELWIVPKCLRLGIWKVMTGSTLLCVDSTFNMQSEAIAQSRCVLLQRDGFIHDLEKELAFNQQLECNPQVLFLNPRQSFISSYSTFMNQPATPSIYRDCLGTTAQFSEDDFWFVADFLKQRFPEHDRQHFLQGLNIICKRLSKSQKQLLLTNDDAQDIFQNIYTFMEAFSLVCDPLDSAYLPRTLLEDRLRLHLQRFPHQANGIFKTTFNGTGEALTFLVFLSGIEWEDAEHNPRVSISLKDFILAASSVSGRKVSAERNMLSTDFMSLLSEAIFWRSHQQTNPECVTLFEVLSAIRPIPRLLAGVLFEFLGSMPLEFLLYQSLCQSPHVIYESVLGDTLQSLKSYLASYDDGVEQFTRQVFHLCSESTLLDTSFVLAVQTMDTFGCRSDDWETLLERLAKALFLSRHLPGQISAQLCASTLKDDEVIGGLIKRFQQMLDPVQTEDVRNFEILRQTFTGGGHDFAEMYAFMDAVKRWEANPENTDELGRLAVVMNKGVTFCQLGAVLLCWDQTLRPRIREILLWMEKHTKQPKEKVYMKEAKMSGKAFMDVVVISSHLLRSSLRIDENVKNSKPASVNDGAVANLVALADLHIETEFAQTKEHILVLSIIEATIRHHIRGIKPSQLFHPESNLLGEYDACFVPKPLPQVGPAVEECRYLFTAQLPFNETAQFVQTFGLFPARLRPLQVRQLYIRGNDSVAEEILHQIHSGLQTLGCFI